MLPLRPREREHERPARKAAPQFKLYRDEFYDPYQYIPARYIPQKLTTRPSKAPPRSTDYEIVDRIPGPDDLPTYIVREVTNGQTAQDGSVEEEEASRKQESGSEGSEPEVKGTVLDPIEYLRMGVLNRSGASGALGRHDKNLTPPSLASRAPVPSSGNCNAGADTFQVPFTRIRSYVSPLQLEHFENFRFRNPKPDDLPYKVSTLSRPTSERESRVIEPRKPIGPPPNKRRKLDGPVVVTPRMNPSATASVIGHSDSTSLKMLDKEDDDEIEVVMDGNGTDKLLHGLPVISMNQPQHGLAERRPRTKSRALRESTATSSASDVLNLHAALSKISQITTAEYHAQRSTHSRSAPATSSAASSPAETQETPHPPNSAIKHRRRRKKKSLTTHHPKQQAPTPQAPDAEVEEGPPGSSDQVYEVSRILTHDYVDNVRYYQVSWTGFPETEENLTWLTEEELQGAAQVLRRYLKYLETGIDDSDDEGNEIEDEDEDTRAIRRVLAEEGIV